jgi:ubiquinone/menaquinone biosynthesis C-methylase UbiE
MKEIEKDSNEQLAAIAFNRQSAVFDELYGSSAIINYKRNRVRSHMDTLLKANSSILELNAGTGEDTLYFAGRGHLVHATDISAGMLGELGKKVKSKDISWEICSFTNLANLQRKGPYDHIFSNFAGLNCTGDLKIALDSFSQLLKPGGVVTLVLLPRFCLWETLLVFRGKFRTAFRRFFAYKGTRSRVAGVYFRCWYYNPSFITRSLKESFQVIGLEGLCSIVPPSYMEGFAYKYPMIYDFLKRKEERLKSSWPWNTIGDYYIISLIKKG